MKVLVEFVTNVANWNKGDRVLVEADHWLNRGGYTRVVERDVPDPDVVRPADDATARVGVARRRPRKAVTDVQDSTESGGSSTVGSDGRSQGRDESGDRSTAPDEEGDA